MQMTQNSKRVNPESSDYTYALQRAERYRLLVEGVQDHAIYMLDTEGTIVTWNAGAHKLKGYPASEVIGQHFSLFYPDEHNRVDSAHAALHDAQHNGIHEDNGWRVKKDGSQFWAHVVITALHNSKGKLIGYAKVTRDLTERKQNEERLINTNMQLEKQRAELEELNAVKDDFVSLVSHQLRAPATGVKQYLGMLLEGHAGELTNSQKSYIQHAYDSNNRQINMVNDLLHVAQVDAGKVELTKSPVDILALLTDVIDEKLDEFRARKQHILIAEHPQPAPLINVDKMRIRMVFENLIDNASKYTPDCGTITLSVIVDESSAYVTITDSGVGIDEASIDALFDKFSRIPNSLSQKVGGTGLGLYWANKVIELHNGTITVSANEPSGTRFVVTVPR